MQVNYSTKKITSSLCLSTQLTLDETRTAPTITWSSDIYKEGEKYTLIMYDPNSVTTSGTYIHWVLINISGNSTSANTKNNIILPYFRPKPPDYKEHCYTFELYSQGKKRLHLNLSKIQNINRDMTVSRLKTILGLDSQLALTTVRFQGNPNARKLTSQKGGTRRRCGRGSGRRCGRGSGRSTRRRCGQLKK
jgi:phosphatidylethanolamine-binding protein (PEBP) family uncharacterized protein